jgi:pilus assembly protein CpaB
MVALSEIPTEAVVTGAVNDLSSVVGKVSDIEIFTGEQILSSKLNSTGDSNSKTLAEAVEPGMRAITLPVDETSGIAFMITPGNHVDIVGYFLKEEEDEETGEKEKLSYAKMLLENILVLAVDNVFPEAGKAGSENPSYTTITLQVTPEQAMELSMAQAEGELRRSCARPWTRTKSIRPG